MKKKLLVALVVVVVFLGCVAAWVTLASSRRINTTYDISATAITLPTATESIAEGKRLLTIRGCRECHGDDLGGRYPLKDTPVGSYYGGNLTRGKGGLTAEYTDAKIARAIRHCVNQKGAPLLFMPCSDYESMSDRDAAMIIAYMRSAQPVDRTNEPNTVTFLAKALFLAGKFPLLEVETINHNKKHAWPDAGATVEYGEYLIKTCSGCHGTGLSGGPMPGVPPEIGIPSNITPEKTTGIGAWTYEQFDTAVRKGIRPSGAAINKFMPTRYFADFTNDEVKALWLYLQNTPPKAFGNR